MHSWRYKRTESIFLCKLTFLVHFRPARAQYIIKKYQYMHINLLSHASPWVQPLGGRGGGGYPELKVTYLSKKDYPSFALNVPHSHGPPSALGVQITWLHAESIVVPFSDNFCQCCGSMTFWCRSGSGSVDPCLWLLDPDPDSDPQHWFLYTCFSGSPAWFRCRSAQSYMYDALPLIAGPKKNGTFSRKSRNKSARKSSGFARTIVFALWLEKPIKPYVWRRPVPPGISSCHQILDSGCMTEPSLEVPASLFGLNMHFI